MSHITGVNLGGWLVLEKWITPSLFKDIDDWNEHSFMRHSSAIRRIEKHRQTFVTEHDFEWLASHGINLVRIPVGYWLFEKIDGFTPTVQYLDDAMRWAEKHGVKVLIDLHAVRGSQNGQDHSGRVGETQWFKSHKNITQTVRLLEQIAHRYKHSSALWGIELLNEPAVKNIRGYLTLLAYYRSSYKKLAKILPVGTHVVFHDAFHPLLFNGVMPRRKSHPAVMDVHWYGFTAKEQTFADYLQNTTAKHRRLLRFLSKRQPVIIGEWSGVLPPQFQKESVKKNIGYQRKVYAHAYASIFWTYKTESNDCWNFRHHIDILNETVNA